MIRRAQLTLLATILAIVSIATSPSALLVAMAKADSDPVALCQEWCDQAGGALSNPEINDIEVEGGGEENSTADLSLGGLQAEVPADPRIMGFAYGYTYWDASKMFPGVDWQILAAVHEKESHSSGNTCSQSGDGAIGPMQFLSSTFKIYAIDGDGDGRADVCSAMDSIYSAANLLWQNGLSYGDTRNAIFSYNHSWTYVNSVLSLARSYGCSC